MSQSLSGVSTSFVEGMWYALGATERYEFVKDLGAGTFGEVKEYRDNETGKHLAFKTVQLDKMPSCYAEVQILRELKGLHPSFLEIENAHIVDNTLTLITEVAPGVELFYHILEYEKLLKVSQVKIIFYRLLEAMAIAHQKKITHRDLKPENIMIHEGDDGEITVKILDWGMAVVDLQPELASGSPNYVAPEVINAEKLTGPWNDVWSLGTILFTMLTQMMAFNAIEIPRLFTQIRNMEVRYDVVGLTPGSIKLLKRIFVHHKSRATCRDLLEDEWFQPTVETSSPTTATSAIGDGAAVRAKNSAEKDEVASTRVSEESYQRDQPYFETQSLPNLHLQEVG